MPTITTGDCTEIFHPGRPVPVGLFCRSGCFPA
jgi:hypothetical protein